MSKTYAIADLHGRLDLLEMALTQIASHAELPATLDLSQNSRLLSIRYK